MSQPVLILGAGGFAREIADIVVDMGPEGGLEVRGFVDRDSSRKGGSLNGLPILGSIDDVAVSPGMGAVAGSGEVEPRRRQAAEIDETGLQVLTLIHPLAVVSPSASIGMGSIVCAHTVVTSNSVLGRYVVVNYGATVGHDVAVGDFTVVGPGARLSGWTTIGAACYLGAGAIVLPKVTVGDGAVIGAGAVVTRDVEPGATVVGVPARPLKRA